LLSRAQTLVISTEKASAVIAKPPVWQKDFTCGKIISSVNALNAHLVSFLPPTPFFSYTFSVDRDKENIK
jgi:hypothetical protein